MEISRTKQSLLVLYAFILLCLADVKPAAGQSTLVPLAEALKQITQTYQINFLYEEVNISAKRVNFNADQFEGKKIDIVLADLLNQVALNWLKIDEKNYSIFLPGKESYSISGVIKDRKGETLPGAAVLLSGYKIGTVANNEGEFIINNIKPGNYDLLIQMVGYLPASQNVIISNKSAGIEIILDENVNQLMEVVIRPDPHRLEHLKTFRESFIGTTPNAAKCKILNEDVIQFDYNAEKRILTAKADEFIIVENKALGYRIKYLLKYFEEDEETNVVFFYGYPYFEEIDGSGSKKKQYLEKRNIAFAGSPEHFFSSLYNNTYRKEGFIINKLIKTVNLKKLSAATIENKINTFSAYLKETGGMWRYQDSLDYWTNMKNEPDTLEVLNRDEVLTDTLVKQSSANLKTINFKDALYIVYTKEKESYDYAKFSGYKINRPQDYSKYQISIINHLKVPVSFYGNGRVHNPTALLYEGYMAYEKVGDMVPIDYKPDKL